jgi:hypothetical protein
MPSPVRMASCTSPAPMPTTAPATVPMGSPTAWPAAHRKSPIWTRVTDLLRSIVAAGWHASVLAPNPYWDGADMDPERMPVVHVMLTS